MFVVYIYLYIDINIIRDIVFREVFMKILINFFSLIVLLILMGVVNILNSVAITILSTWFFLGTIICLKQLDGSMFKSGFVSLILIILGPFSYPTIHELKRRNEW